MRGRGRADAVAVRLGVGLRDARIAAAMTQAEAADRARISQARWSELERGLGANAPIEVWALVAAAVGVQLAAFLEQVSGAGLPRDMEHLRRQSAVIAQGSRRRLVPRARDAGDAGRFRPRDRRLSDEGLPPRGGRGRGVGSPPRHRCCVPVVRRQAGGCPDAPPGLDRLGSVGPPWHEAQPRPGGRARAPRSQPASPATEGRGLPPSTSRPARCRRARRSCGPMPRRRRSRRGGAPAASTGERRGQ